MALYRFRVTFEDHDDVSRDIEIRPTQTFSDFHHAIHQSIGFDASKPGSFYMSDDNWKKGKEITSRELTEEESNIATMENARLCNFIADPHQKIYYVFDLLGNWTFHIELIKIIPRLIRLLPIHNAFERMVKLQNNTVGQGLEYCLFLTTLIRMQIFLTWMMKSKRIVKKKFSAPMKPIFRKVKKIPTHLQQQLMWKVTPMNLKLPMKISSMMRDHQNPTTFSCTRN
ncbi:MAG: hypothetical protein IPO39_08580 [Bacteroidetes bacterium]|nr:hypothetical protein [Bacteroidota bacterium]